MKRGNEVKMDITKIIKISRKKKSCGGYNSKWLVRCNNCGEIFIVWDTDMYNCPCPHCKNNLKVDSRNTTEKKEKIFRINRRLYSEYKSTNVISAKENSILVELRETEFKSVLKDLVSDYWFKLNEPYKYCLKEEKLLDIRSRSLLKNDTFMQLLKECYDLIYPRTNKQ